MSLTFLNHLCLCWPMKSWDPLFLAWLLISFYIKSPQHSIRSFRPLWVSQSLNITQTIQQIQCNTIKFDKLKVNHVFSVQSFLSLCQGNHYQFDTIRRAKHSSMMVLYHLHNPEAPAFVSTCNNCQAEIEPGEGYRCTVCQDYDLCRICREEKGVQHDHPLKVNLISL